LPVSGAPERPVTALAQARRDDRGGNIATGHATDQSRSASRARQSLMESGTVRIISIGSLIIGVTVAALPSL
jgi:hypothetical protein